MCGVRSAYSPQSSHWTMVKTYGSPENRRVLFSCQIRRNVDLHERAATSGRRRAPQDHNGCHAVLRRLGTLDGGLSGNLRLETLPVTACCRKRGRRDAMRGTHIRSPGLCGPQLADGARWGEEEKQSCSSSERTEGACDALVDLPLPGVGKPAPVLLTAQHVACDCANCQLRGRQSWPSLTPGGNPKCAHALSPSF